MATSPARTMWRRSGGTAARAAAVTTPAGWPSNADSDSSGWKRPEYGAAPVPIATAANTAGPPIEIGNHPDGIAITPDGKTVYVANINSGTVTPIETATNTAGTPIEVGEGARAIVITADGETAYVGVWGEPGTVTPIATATNTAGTPIEVGDGPYAIAITPGASRL